MQSDIPNRCQWLDVASKVLEGLTTKTMIYGQFQYYRDEIKSWLRTIEFCKNDLRDLLKQLNVSLSFPLVSLPDAKAAQALIEQLMFQKQRFDHTRQHFQLQAQRLRNVKSSDKLEHVVNSGQERCRVKMKIYELAFIRTKYDCSVFLSSFFQPAQLVVQ